jgi:hypothetical protein
MFFTRHFHERVFERFGIALTGEELNKIQNGILKTRDGLPFDEYEEFDVFLNHRSLYMLLVMRSGRIVTAHRNKKMGRKKFLKWNLDRTKSVL